MKALANFPRVERLPEMPGVPKLTGTGFVVDGKTTRTVPRPSEAMQESKRSLFGWIWK